jgi:APA family basic amino acid/polyamine antiporter
MAFGSYFAGAVPGTSPLLLALTVVWSVSLIHLTGVDRASAFQNASTLVKVVMIVAFIAAALVVAVPQPISFAPSARDVGYIASPAFAVSLAFVMYSYTGWNAVTYIAGEVRDPARTLPLSVIAAVVTVSILYVGLNAVFLYSTPISELSGQIDVAVIAGNYIFGDIGGRIVGALICVGLISSIGAMMWVGPRVTMVMGEDHALLAPFARKTRGGVPLTAVLFQLSVVSLLLLTQSFESILEFIQFSLTISSFLTVLGVIVLRFRAPELVRPYKVWGYPLTPLLFLAVSLFMMANLLWARPLQSLAGVGIMLTGLLVYAFSQRSART